MTSELQKAQDMLGIMEAQRNDALNVIVMVRTENAALKREIANLQQAMLAANSPPDIAECQPS